MKRLLIFGDALTFPGAEGVSKHTMSLISYITSNNSKDIHPILVMCDRGTISNGDLRKIPCEVVLVTPNTFYSYQKMKKIILKLYPDILQSNDSYQARLITARYSIEFKTPLLMEHHDIDTEFVKNYPNCDNNRGYDSLQLQVCNQASVNRTISSKDMDILIKIMPDRSCSFVNIPTAISNDDYPDTQQRKRTNVMFIGNCAYPPNREALDFICSELALSMPNINFHLIGRMTDVLDPHLKNVYAYGQVNDISVISRIMSYGISPLMRGSGLKIKVITLLSNGLPVIGTPETFDGYNRAASLIETSIDNFKKTLSSCISAYSPTKSIEARSLFEDVYSAKIIMPELIKVYLGVEFNINKTTISEFSPIKRDDSYLVWLEEPREVFSKPVKKLLF